MEGLGDFVHSAALHPASRCGSVGGVGKVKACHKIKKRKRKEKGEIKRKKTKPGQ
jgi:hypothetical protein